MIDAASFFYQWDVWSEHWDRVCEISHRGQEFFKVAVMGYWMEVTVAHFDHLSAKLDVPRSLRICKEN